MKKALLCLLLFAMILGACNGPTPTQSPEPIQPTQPSLPTPQTILAEPPDAEEAAIQYLRSWQAEDYPAMYALLSRLTRDAMTEEAFTTKHKEAAIALTLKEMTYEVMSMLVNPGSAQANYQISYETNLFGEISGSTVMNLVLEDNIWHVQWEDGMILPQLAGGNKLLIQRLVPARGNIYASSGYPMVAQNDAVAISVVPGRINPALEDDMVAFLAELTGQTEGQVRDRYRYYQPDWQAPIGDISKAEAEANQSELYSYPGILMTPFRSRYYTDSGIAPHTTGYVQSIFPEELEYYQRLGYGGDEKIGKMGLEAWAERYLAGTHGASLYVIDPSGKTLTRLATAEAKPASSITTTIDSVIQYNLQRSFGDYKGAVVMIELQTGRIIAMASNPGYDPNIFEPTSGASATLAETMSDPNLPFYNRASQGQYPLGSVFKIITMAAALETGVFTKDYPYYCDSYWTEAGVRLEDWTVRRELPASGMLTLQQGLMRSCNPWFWHIGYTLWNDGYTSAIYDVAGAFGLGKLTGVEGEENAGNLQMPATLMDNVNLSIGQGTLQVTPLQVAMFVAAVGNDGTLYRPTVIDKITPIDGTADLYTFKPDEIGKLPITEDNLDAIQQAMVWVVENRNGTGYWELRSLTGNLAGKTGTAENPPLESHAWFGGYTWNENPNKPDIAVVAFLENAGEGSEMAAPLFRRAVSLYYSNGRDAGGTMPWEERPYVPATETPSPDTAP